MNRENILKKLFAVFLSASFAISMFAQSSSHNERAARPVSSVNTSSSNGGKSSSTSGGNSSSSRNERSERSTNERPSRPSGERPSRPQSSNKATHHGHGSYSDHHHYDDHHHHHGHSSGTVVVAGTGTGYAAVSSSNNETVPSVRRQHDINRFMLFANLSCGVSYRGASGVREYEYCDEDDQIDEENRAFGESLGYNVELRTDVGLTSRLYCSSGVGFTKQSFYKMFSPGNYMSSTKRFLEIPLMFGYRNDDDEELIFSISMGPRFTYGINGICDEYYDFYPDPDYGVFSHSSYGGKYGVDRFAVGGGLEANIVIFRLLLGFNFSLYPNNDCKPAELYDGLYRRFHSCRTNISIKAGWKIF